MNIKIDQNQSHVNNKLHFNLFDFSPNPFKRCGCLFVWKLHSKVSHTVANARITIGFMIATMPKMNVGACVLEAKTYVRFSG